MKTIWVPKIYQEDPPEDRTDHVEMVSKADHDASEIKWMNIVTKIQRQRDDAIAAAGKKEL